MDKDNTNTRILEEEDYIRCPKSGNSLSKFLAKNEDGVDDAAIARLLMISEERVQEIYEAAVDELKKGMAEDEEG